MEMRFNLKEIMQLIDFSLKNGGAVVKIADEAFVKTFNEENGIYLIQIADDEELEDVGPSETEAPPKKQRKKREAKFSKVCGTCGDAFMSAHPNAKYCSDSCRRAGWEQRRNTDG
jgi:hypothetical protein